MPFPDAPPLAHPSRRAAARSFDPLNPPLPSTLSRKNKPGADRLEARLAAGELPPVSELDSPSGQVPARPGPNSARFAGPDLPGWAA